MFRGKYTRFSEYNFGIRCQIMEQSCCNQQGYTRFVLYNTILYIQGFIL